MAHVSKRDLVAQTIRDLYDGAEPGEYLGSVLSISSLADASTGTTVEGIASASEDGLDIVSIRGPRDEVRSFGGYYRGPRDLVAKVNNIPADSAAGQFLLEGKAEGLNDRPLTARLGNASVTRQHDQLTIVCPASVRITIERT